MSNQKNADLIAAVSSRNVDAVTRLVSEPDVDKNCRDKEEQTALCMAARYAQLEIVNLLLKAGANVNTRGQYNIAPLCWGVYSESLPIVKALVQAGADVNEQGNSFIYTALFHAALKGLAEIVGFLLTCGADPNIVGEGGKTPLDVAKTEAIKQLIRSVSQSDLKLIAEIRRVQVHAAGAPARREWMQRRDSLQAQYDAAEKAFDFAACGKVLLLITSEEKASIALVPSVEDYKSLLERHEKVVAALEAKCVELLAVNDFDTVDMWSAKLTPLTQLDISAMTFPPDAEVSAKVDASPAADPAALSKQSSEIKDRCVVLMSQAAGVDARREWIKRREDMEVKYGAAEGDLLYAECAKLWQEITAHDKLSTSLVPSVEDFKTLAERHEKLTKAVDTHCKVLLAAKDFPTLEVLSLALTKLGELDAAKLVFPADAKLCALPSVEPNKGFVYSTSPLQNRCQAIVDQHKLIATQTAGVKAIEDWVQRRAAVKEKYEAAQKAKQFAECSKLGRDSVALDAESAKLDLSFENYKSLDGRREKMIADHQQLVSEVLAVRKELLAVKDFAGLDALGQVLAMLQALDLKCLPPTLGLVVPEKPPSATATSTTANATASATSKTTANNVNTTTATNATAVPTPAVSSTDVKLAYTGDPVSKVADPVTVKDSDPKHAEVTGAQCTCVIM